ncbi:unnamed protein product [Musa hybrid cultivar]
MAASRGGSEQDVFYLRYYVEHKGKFGHEFLERCSVPAVLRECRRIIADSEVPLPPLTIMEVVMNNEHISFTTSKTGSLVDVQGSQDRKGLRVFYYLVQVLE